MKETWLVPYTDIVWNKMSNPGNYELIWCTHVGVGINVSSAWVQTYGGLETTYQGKKGGGV